MKAGLFALTNQTFRSIFGTMCFSKVAAAIGTAKAKVTSGATAVYSIGGRMYSKAGTADLWTLSGTALSAAGGTTRFLLCLNASGTASVIQGDATGYSSVELPMDSAGAPTVCPVAELKVVADAVAFTPGTTLLDAAGITATYTDLSMFPAEGYGA